MTPPLSWFGIARLGFVQAALGAIVVMVTSTLNRVMVVELALPAIVPGLLVALHYGVQLLRPRWGHGSDSAGRRTPSIMGGMLALAGGGITAALSVAAIPRHPALGLMAAALAFAVVGLGVGASGTGILVLAATRVAPERRAVAAPLMWIMMIAGFAITAGVAGAQLDPFSFPTLVRVTATVCLSAVALTGLALWRLERPGAPARPENATRSPAFRAALRQIWAEPEVRRFTLFVFLSMLAYSAQDLVLEPFAGAVLRLPPGGTTQLSGVQHGGALVGMLVVALLGGTLRRRRPAIMGHLAVAGCLLSAAILLLLAVTGCVGTAGQLLRPAVALLGFGNGCFAVAAVGAMMALAAHGAGRREGLRMGVWGAAQAAAFGVGSLAGPGLVDLARFTLTTPGAAYGAVFLAEALLFLVAAGLAGRTLGAKLPTSVALRLAAEPA